MQPQPQQQQEEEEEEEQHGRAAHGDDAGDGAARLHGIGEGDSARDGGILISAAASNDGETPTPSPGDSPWAPQPQDHQVWFKAYAVVAGGCWSLATICITIKFPNEYV